MKSKLIFGLATLAALALPAAAQQTNCYLDRDGDRQTCVTRIYPNQRYAYDPNRFSGGYYNGYDRDYWRDHERREWRERREHERHEWREHHGDRDWR